MSAEPRPRRRKQSQFAPGAFDASAFPGMRTKPPSEWTHEFHNTRWEAFMLRLSHIRVNFWPNIRYFMSKHPFLVQLSYRITIAITIALSIILLFFRPTFEPRFKTLSLWHAQLHNAWLHDHSIRESTWILDEDAKSHTSNDPSLTNDVLLQFPQRNGGSSIQLRDVRFDAKAHYGVISMAKLEEEHVPLRTLFGVGDGRPVMGVEVIGRDIVAMSWGSGGGKGTYMLKAWSRSRCEPGLVSLIFFFGAYDPVCAVLGLWNWNARGDIPAETMRELVDKHRIVPAANKDERGKEEATPWRQRALDKESDVAQKERKKRSFWGLG